MKNNLKYFLFIFFTFFNISLHAKSTINIGIVLDGDIQREILPLQQIKKEITELIAGEFKIEFPESKLVHGDWKVSGIKAQLNNLLNDPDVDLIIANGLLSSHEASKIKNLKKPIIAPVVADRALQKLPYDNGKTGKHNYVYISDDRTVAQDLNQFYELINFKHLAIMVDRLFIEALPELKGTTYQVQKDLGFEITFLPVMDDPFSLLADDLPQSIDAIYFPPLFRFNESVMTEVADRLIELKLPSFSLLGRQELELGLLATLSGREVDTIRYARRIALYVQSILLGADPADLKVGLEQPSKLAINMQTARAIGYSPTWRILEIADLLYKEDNGIKTQINLLDAVEQAIDSNLSLQIDKLDLAIAQDQVNNARSPLLPQIDIGAGVTQIDRDRAGFQQAQRSSDADITASQLLYSETARSGYDVAKYLEQAEDAALKASILDVIQTSATAYLQLLLTQATEKIRESNLNVTETNLELAETRLKIGYSDRSDMLRWKSQLATDRSNLYISQAQKDQAETELKRILNMEQSEEIAVSDEGISELLTILGSDRFKRFFDNPLSFERFTQFEVERALDNSPELQEINYLISSNQRELLAAKRAYYVPDVSVNAQYGRNIERGGLGENNNNFTDDNWTLGLQATLPLFAGGARKAEVSRANNSLVQSQYRMHNIKQQIETRVLAALQQASGSYPAIRLSRDAATAAEENLSLVIDSYSKGVVSITDLINAQDATLAANLSSIEAQYSFMIDWINIQRAVANFDVLLSPGGLDSWYQDLNLYYQSNN